MDLSFNDKRLVGFFDKDFARCMGFVRQIPAGTLQDAAKVKEYRDLGARLRERLAPIGQQDHPEIVKRRRQVEEYDAALAAAMGPQGPGAAAATPAAPAQARADARTDAAPAAAPTTPAAPLAPRSAGDALKAFATLYNRWMTYLRAERPHALAKPPMLQKYRAAAAEMEAAIARAAGLASADAQAAREQVAAYLRTIDEMVASAEASLSGDDSLRVKRLRDEHATAVAALRACDRTVLGTDGGEGPFHAISRRLHEMLALVQNGEHPDAKAAAAALAELDALLEEKTASSRAALVDIQAAGELFATIEGRLRAFADPSFPPRISPEPGDQDIARFAAALLDWEKKLEAAVPYLERVLRWAPMLEGKVEPCDRIRRFLADAPQLLSAARTDVTADWKAGVEKALAIDPARLDPGLLADGAQEATAILDAGAICARRLARFAETYSGKRDPAAEAVVADIEARAASIRSLCAQAAEDRLRNARMPEALDLPELLEIAKELIKLPAERVIVTREVRRTERESQPVGGFVYLEVYDVFWAHAAVREDDGTYRIYEYSFCYSLRGTPGTACNHWAVAEAYPGQRILPENIDLPP